MEGETPQRDQKSLIKGSSFILKKTSFKIEDIPTLIKG